MSGLPRHRRTPLPPLARREVEPKPEPESDLKSASKHAAPLDTVRRILRRNSVQYIPYLVVSPLPAEIPDKLSGVCQESGIVNPLIR